MVSFVKSCETYLLIFVILSFLYNIIVNFRGSPGYVRFFRNFEEFSQATVKCRPSETAIGRNESEELPECPIDRDRLKYYNENYNELNPWLNYNHVQHGGKFTPLGCRPIQKVAIVIPYRNREEQLERLSLYIHQFLPDQLIEYSLYVIEQSDDKPFNRAKLFNIGISEKNLYMCTTLPRHMVTNLSTMRFHLLYPQLFGGAIALTKEQYSNIGGFSNDFYGWGGEDDDMFNRVRAHGYEIDRTPIEFGDYHMMRHSKSRPNPERFKLLSERSRGDVNSTNSSYYELIKIDQEKLYTMISVRI